MTRTEIEERAGVVAFKWNGALKGIGEVRHDARTARVFIIERSARASDSIVSESRRIFDSFATHADLIPWSVLDFQVRLPEDICLASYKFLTGRLTFNFVGKNIQATAERWGLAKTILSKFPLQNWAENITDMKCVSDDVDALHLKGKPPIVRRLAGYTAESLVLHEEPLNRVVLIKTIHKNRPPEWCWLRHE
jgi:hypothetical protein